MDILAKKTSADNAASDLLRPMLHTGRGFYFLIGALFILVGWFGYALFQQMTQGLYVTNMRTPVGAAWGSYIANFVFYVGLAHGGIAIAAAIRLMNLTKYQPIARIGELITVIALMMAGVSIVIDMGRPDRVFNLIVFWPERITTSSLSWDVTVIILYFTMSVTYLWLTMRKDLRLSMNRFPKLRPLYKFLLIGYRPEEDQAIHRLTWWLSIAILFLVVMLSGGVVAWIFGLLPSRPGWFSALAGPYFLTAAISSAIAAVLVVSAIVRKAFHWEHHIKPEIFRGLGTFMGILTFFYIYLVFSEQLTANYAAPLPEFLVSAKILQGEFAPVFWPMIIFGFFLPALTLVIQGARPKLFSLARTVTASVLLIVGFWTKRFLIVVPSLLRPLLPFPEGHYSPSWLEWSVIIGTVAIAALIFIAFIKIFPILDLSEE